MVFINKSIFVEKSSRFFIREEPVRKPIKNEVTIKILRSSICSSDMNRVLVKEHITIQYYSGMNLVALL